MWASYFDHVIVAPELGRRITLQTRGKVNPHAVGTLLWFHDTGRLALPAAYARNDLVADRLMYEGHVSPSVTQDIPSVTELMRKADEMQITDEQLRDAGLTEDQLKIAENYFSEMSLTMRVVNLADNLGKRDAGGGIFTYRKFIDYLKSQEERYRKSAGSFTQTGKTGWPSIDYSITDRHREEGAKLQALIVGVTIDWLDGLGVDIDSITDGLHDYGPNF